MVTEFGVQPAIVRIAHPLADIWIGSDGDEGVDYAYGGTRLVRPETPDDRTEAVLNRLMVYESWLKNRLINEAVEAGALDDLDDRLPARFLSSRVGGARCVIRPRDTRIQEGMGDPEHHMFRPWIEAVFRKIGDFLNANDGRIKLTPDFGKFAGVADILHRFTPHTLGIHRDRGGCGGKTSFSTTGITAAFELIEPDIREPVTVIGAAGAMGAQVSAYLLDRRIANVALCDLVFRNRATAPHEDATVLDAEPGRFTPECLGRGGVVVATTWGEELENSDLDTLKPGTVLLLAHNLALPPDEPGMRLAGELAERGVTVLPGQLLTLGGALTARLEWFWRASGTAEQFDKPLAHTVVTRVVTHLIQRYALRLPPDSPSPYHAMVAAQRPDR